MKKFILLIITIIILTGCSKHTISINNTISINYNNINIVEDDYNKITTIINNINFYCGKAININENVLTITTNDIIYKFDISSNYYMEYQNNNKYCHTKDSEKVKILIDTLNEIVKKYQDISYFTIRNENNYDVQDGDSFIKLDKKNDYIIINSLYPLYNFKINQIELDNNNSFKEIAPLYSIDTIDKQTNIVIRKEILKDPDFKISFKNQYGYLANILPFRNDNNEVNFLTKIEK